MFKSTDNINLKHNAKTDNIFETPKHDENNKPSRIQDLNSHNLSEIPNNNEENLFENNHEKEDLYENKPNMTKEELECLIDNKRSELDIRIFDLVTKNQIEEKKLEELYNNEIDEELKSNLMRKLEEKIKNNEENLALLKE